MISKNHSNRRHRNWLIYNIYDGFLQKYSDHYKGVLYDLGCGESPYKNFFMEYVEQYIAVDWAVSAHQTDLDVVADLNKALPIESEVADTVVSLSVLEHLYAPQIMLDEAYRILRPGGTIIIQVPWQWMIHEEPHDFFRYTPYGLKYMLEKAGFSDVEVEPQSGYFTMRVLKLNYFLGRFIPESGPFRWLIGGVFLPIFYVGQYFAPHLDKLDKNWALESSGFFATAKKI